jgi:peptidoglycan-N-acetylglucosamine deacetylase
LNAGGKIDCGRTRGVTIFNCIKPEEAGVAAKTATRSKKKRGRRASIVKPVYATAAATRQIWLTFDDGPHPTSTDKVLATLAQHGIKATFFVVGENVKTRKAIVQRAFDAGHRIGNHSYSHPNLTTLSAVQVRDQIVKTEALIGTFMGNKKIFRPPYGAHNAQVDQLIRGHGYRSIFWNVDTEDWNKKNQPTGWITLGLNQIKVRSDCRVLNHDIHATTAANLATFIQRIKQLGNVTFMDPSTL